MKRNCGSSIITTPIIIAIGMMFVGALILLIVNIVMPYIWYEKLSSTCIKYVFVMEEYGYLTRQEKNNLINELANQGFEKNNIKIDCTSSMQSYGNRIYLRANYDYELKLPFMDEYIIPMEINRISVSKR